jgi:hypothetical protein
MVRVKPSPNRQSVKLRKFCVQGLFTALVSMILLAACTSPQVATPVQSQSPAPLSTSTAIAQATAPELIDIQSGGFNVALQPGLEFEAHEDSISISDRQGELVISLNGRPYVASSYTLQSFLEKYLAEMAARGGSIEESGEPYEIVIDGRSGLAVDFSGKFLDHPVTGKAVAISPGKDFIVFGLGMSLLSENQNGWDESGSLIFETILESIDFKEEVK